MDFSKPSSGISGAGTSSSPAVECAQPSLTVLSETDELNVGAVPERKVVTRSALLKLITAINGIRITLRNRARLPIDYFIRDIDAAKNSIQTLLGEIVMPDRYPEPVEQLLSEMLRDYRHPDNLNVIARMVECGVGINKLDFLQLSIPAVILSKALSNSPFARDIMLSGANSLIWSESDEYYNILSKYISEEEVDHFISYKNVEVLDDELHSYHLHQEVFKKVVSVILSGVFDETEVCDSKEPSTFIDFLQSESLLRGLSVLTVNIASNSDILEKELSRLDKRKCESLLVLSFLLGQSNLFFMLRHILSDNIDCLYSIGTDGRNFLHIMAIALPSLNEYKHPETPVRALQQYHPDYRAIGSVLNNIGTLANSKDRENRYPLELLYEYACGSFSESNFMGIEHNLVFSRREFLLFYSRPYVIPVSMKILLKSEHIGRSFNWFREFLYLHTSNVVAVKERDYDTYCVLASQVERTGVGRMNSQQFKTLSERIIPFFAQYPGVLSNLEELSELLNIMQSESLPSLFQAVTLSFVKPELKQRLYTSWDSNPRRLNELFIRDNYRLSNNREFNPWHFWAYCLPADYSSTFGKVQHGIALAFQQRVSDFCDKSPPDSLIALPPHWLEVLRQSTDKGVYGRSLYFDRGDGHYRRIKLRKQQNYQVEPWSDFIREQPHLMFFREHKTILGLESALLEPKGLYRLENVKSAISSAGFTREELEGLLELISIEENGAAYVQVFDDDVPGLPYHRYPYDADAQTEDTLEASFAGLLMFARDAGRLISHGFVPPDALSAFHNLFNQRGWIPTPMFSGGDLPGVLLGWNRLNYPNIAPAPVGMRDIADIRLFMELAQTILEFRFTDVSRDEHLAFVRMTVLGQALYGLVINWLRVLHDRHELDYCNTLHIASLKERVTLLAANLMGAAHQVELHTMEEYIRLYFPLEALHRMAMEAAYWCDPCCRYVQDLENNRVPETVYPEHPARQQFYKPTLVANRQLTRFGFVDSLDGQIPDLGYETLPLNHLDSLFWFCIWQGWRFLTKA